ncbi:MFS transporter [Micromonospora sp. PLK6-60]|uniref:MFS transporter n=1 Tax=Micromonospora sp. PLK6-60 TaxID=2873383 RepID=UPI001CA76B06|nr:MFS transporter [Micromonospora sp. PLK6-60]MBY8870406.1 MFS transporter [Micromonospora sp. PLK6-60]
MSRPRPGRLLWLAGAAQAAVGFSVTSLGAVLVLLARDVGAAPEDLAWLPSTFGAGLVAVAVAGPWLLRDGHRHCLWLGGGALGTGAVLLALAATVPMAVAGSVLLGLGAAALVLATPALLSGPDAGRRLSLVSAVASTAALTAPLALAVADHGGGDGRLALLALTPLAALLLAVTPRHHGTRPARGRRAGARGRRRGAAGPPAARARPAAGPGVPPGEGPAEPHQPAAREVPPPGRPAGPYVRVAGTARRGDVVRRWSQVVLAVSVEFCFSVWAVARLQQTGLAVATAVALATSFPAGMALGRLAASRGARSGPLIAAGAAVTALGAVTVAAAARPGWAVLGLVLAGLGVAVLYPLTLAGLMATPGLSAPVAASLGALASGTAILVAPAALAALGRSVGLGAAFLVTPVLLALLLGLRRAAGGPTTPDRAATGPRH